MKIEQIKMGAIKMKIAAGIVSCEGYGNPDANDNLLNIYQQILNESNKKKVDLLCLPGGYLRARSRKDKEELAKSLVENAKNYKIAIAVGIDVIDGRSKPVKSSKSRKSKKTTSSNNILAFAICWSPAERQNYHCWQQRSRTSSDYKTASNKKKETYREQRTLLVGDGSVEILLCGEVFNRIIRNNVIIRSSDIATVVDLVHDLCGFRATGSMKNLAKNGLTTLCSGHLKRHSGMKFRYDPKVGNGWLCNSSRDAEISLEGPPRIELKIWDV